MAASLDGMAASSSIILPSGRVDGNPKSPLQKIWIYKQLFYKAL
jgi:hypothetical protein